MYEEYPFRWILKEFLFGARKIERDKDQKYACVHTSERSSANIPYALQINMYVYGFMRVVA